MRGRGLFFLIPLVLGLTLIASCKPINLFSPFIDPSRLGNDAKLEAGYNAIADGDYSEAVDYFSDVIDSSSGDQLTDALIGRATAYIKIGAPGLDDAMSDIMEGETDIDSLGQFIRTLMGPDDPTEDNEYITFFTMMKAAANDYNWAMANSGGITDSGLLIEIYQTNMMAATGVGAIKISLEDHWIVVGVNDAEIDLILEGTTGGYSHNIDTWGNPGSPNGLNDHVNEDPDSPDEIEMLVYLQAAFDALTALEADPPLDMDVPSMKSGINEWVINGLGIAGGLS